MASVGVAVRGTLVRDADTPTEIAELRAERDESARQLAEATEKNARLASKLEVLRVRIDAALQDAQARVASGAAASEPPASDPSFPTASRKRGKGGGARGRRAVEKPWETGGAGRGAVARRNFLATAQTTACSQSISQGTNLKARQNHGSLSLQ